MLPPVWNNLSVLYKPGLEPNLAKTQKQTNQQQKKKKKTTKAENKTEISVCEGKLSLCFRSTLETRRHVSGLKCPYKGIALEIKYIDFRRCVHLYILMSLQNDQIIFKKLKHDSYKLFI